MKKYIDNFKLLFGVVLCSIRAKKLYMVDFVWCLRRGLSLVKKHRFTPDESFEWGLYDPSLNETDLSGFVSKRTLNNIQNKINPVEFYYLTEDKAIFYRLCHSCGLPVPELFAIAYSGFSSWTKDRRRPYTVNDWIDFLEFNHLKDFIIKPSRSVFGRGVVAWKASSDAYISSAGNTYTIDEFAEYLHNCNVENGIVIQERLYNDPRFQSFNKSDFLQTIRLFTYIRNEGQIIVLIAFLKGIFGQKVTDHFLAGEHGNFAVSLDISSGKPVEILERHDNNMTVKRSSWIDYCSNHNEARHDFTVPFWNEVCALAIQAAEVFQPLRIIGWDIAVTADGPVLLEGNFRGGIYRTTDMRFLLQPLFDDFAAKQ